MLVLVICVDFLHYEHIVQYTFVIVHWHETVLLLSLILALFLFHQKIKLLGFYINYCIHPNSQGIWLHPY